MSARNLVLGLVLLLITPIAVSAELRRVSVEVLGMDCGVCAHAVLVTLRKLQGVDRVDVSLTSGLATVVMKDENSVTLEQIAHVIKRNGFSASKAHVVAAGTLKLAEGRLSMDTGNGVTLMIVSDRSQPDLYQRLVSRFIQKGRFDGELTGSVEFTGVQPGPINAQAFTPVDVPAPRQSRGPLSHLQPHSE